MNLDALCTQHSGYPRGTYTTGSLGMHTLVQGDTAILSGCYWVEKQRIDVESLTLHPQGGLVPLKPWSLVVPHPTSKIHVGVPKFFGMSALGLPKKDTRCSGEQRTYAFTPTLRPEQELGVAKTIATLKQWGGAFFVADCGFGKTVCIASLIARLGVTAMVVVPRITLIEQCMSSLPAMMPGIDIGVLQGAYTGEKHSVMVASLDSLAQISYPQTLLDSFGLVIFDEAHHMAASTLSKILPRICARNVVGFSATPDRRDGLEHALYWLLGPTSFVYQRLPSITGISHTVEIQYTPSPSHVPDLLLYTGTLNFSGMITSLTLNESRNAFLVSLAKSLDRRKILMITALREHVDTLHEMLGGTPHEAVHGGMNARARSRVAVDTRILVATYGMLEEGFDDPAIDTLILCTPRSRVQQTIGRAERTSPGKLKPRVYDVVDDNHVFQAMWHKRSDFYATRGFLIQGVAPKAATAEFCDVEIV